jgi:hypothetical protein
MFILLRTEILSFITFCKCMGCNQMIFHSPLKLFLCKNVHQFNSVVQILPLEVDSCSAGQEIPFL